MLALANAYQPLIGRRLDALAWRPLTFDTAGLVAGLHSPTIEFTGAVSMFFGAEEIALSWFNASDGDYYLYPCDPSDWSTFSLDLVHASTEQPWGSIVGAQLAEVSFFMHRTIPERCAAVRHVLVVDSRQIEVWIGVGENGRIEGRDELLARIGAKPDNFDELELREALPRE
jgi:hypothetical protein